MGSDLFYLQQDIDSRNAPKQHRNSQIMKDALEHIVKMTPKASRESVIAYAAATLRRLETMEEIH